MKSLIIGAQGLVGSALSKRLPKSIRGIQVEPSRENEVLTDITKYETLFKVFSTHRPDIVYLPAAIAHVDKCEELSTNVVNIRGAITVLRLCEQFDSKLIYYSSSYVFDGEAKEPYMVNAVTNPVQNYGRQKLSVERTILQSDARYVIIRTVGVFGEERRKKNFGKQITNAIFHGKIVFAPTDQFMNPILATDLADISIQLAEAKAKGIYHVAGDECVSKFEFAQRIAKNFGLEHLVKGVSSDEMKQKARRPRMGALNCNTLLDVDCKIPSLDGGLSKFLQMEYNG